MCAAHAWSDSAGSRVRVNACVWRSTPPLARAPRLAWTRSAGPLHLGLLARPLRSVGWANRHTCRFRSQGRVAYTAAERVAGPSQLATLSKLYSADSSLTALQCGLPACSVERLQARAINRPVAKAHRPCSGASLYACFPACWLACLAHPAVKPASPSLAACQPCRPAGFAVRGAR